MNPLDSKRINSHAPYQVKESDDINFFEFSTIILRNDNPRLVDTIAEFTSTVSLLNQKP